MTNKMTIAERTSSNWHRSHIIIRETDGQWILAEFDNVEQLDFFANTLGVTYEAVSWRDTQECGIIREYRMSHQIKTNHAGGFWSLDELPEDVRPIKALSNGSIVTCYFLNDGETVTIYRPNPNAKAVYHPMTIEQHIAHRQIYGCY